MPHVLTPRRERQLFYSRLYTSAAIETVSFTRNVHPEIETRPITRQRNGSQAVQDLGQSAPVMM